MRGAQVSLLYPGVNVKSQPIQVNQSSQCAVNGISSDESLQVRNDPAPRSEWPPRLILCPVEEVHQPQYRRAITTDGTNSPGVQLDETPATGMTNSTGARHGPIYPCMNAGRMRSSPLTISWPFLLCDSPGAQRAQGEDGLASPQPDQSWEGGVALLLAVNPPSACCAAKPGGLRDADKQLLHDVLRSR